MELFSAPVHFNVWDNLLSENRAKVKENRTRNVDERFHTNTTELLLRKLIVHRDGIKTLN